MKKLIICISTIIVAAAITAIIANPINDELSELTKANIEALAEDRPGLDTGSGCYGPKIVSWGKPICRCTNSTPCKDTYGCN